MAVLVSDTSGRAWRNGQTDIAVGCAGLAVLDDHAGRRDGYGNELVVTAPAVADEITAAADLVTGKLSRSPAAVVRGLSRLVLPPGEHGPGAGALVRPEAADMFGLGAREAVVAALTRDAARGFGAPVPPGELLDALGRLLGAVAPGSAAPEAGPAGPDAARVEVVLPEPPSAVDTERAAVLAHALGWAHEAAAEPDRPPSRLRFVRLDP